MYLWHNLEAITGPDRLHTGYIHCTKRCKYVNLKYVWRCWIKITFFHIHMAWFFFFFIAAAPTWTLHRMPRMFSCKSSEKTINFLIFFAAFNFLLERGEKKKLSLSFHLCLQPFTLLWPLRNVTFNSSNTQMSIAGQCLFLEHTRGSTYAACSLYLSFRGDRWHSSNTEHQHYLNSSTYIPFYLIHFCLWIIVWPIRAWLVSTVCVLWLP